MATLYSWTSDAAGNEQARDDTELDVQVSGLVMATAELASNLLSLSSDEFLKAALDQWIKDGKISQLSIGHGLFWNVELRD
jgi:hypothetical protein